MALPKLVDHLDIADGPSDEEEEKMRSVRDQNLLLLDLPLVDHRANMRRLWESLKWNPGMRKGLKREIDSEFQDAEEVTIGDNGELIDSESHGPGEIHGGFGNATLRECLDRINQSRTDAAPFRGRN